MFAIDNNGRVTVNAPLDRDIVNFMTFKLFVQDTRVTPPQEGYGKRKSSRLMCLKKCLSRTPYCVSDLSSVGVKVFDVPN